MSKGIQICKILGPNFLDFEQFFCVFLVLDHSKTLQSSKYAYGGLIPGAGIKKLGYFYKISFFWKFGVDFDIQFFVFLAITGAKMNIFLIRFFQ